MKVTICGSIAFFDKIQEIKKKLEDLGHDVEIPPTKIKDKNGDMISVQDYYIKRKSVVYNDAWIWDRKEEAMRLHFDKVEWCDVILILNYDKSKIKNYIGANTFLEMGVAFFLNKKIFLYNNIPDIGSKEEILGMKPVIINQDLLQIK